MINKLYLKNFKCFKENIFPLKRLNLFTGFNAAGKSTTLQSLLLHTQIKSCNSKLFLNLNGAKIKLGSTGDVLSRNADERNIEFLYEIDGIEKKIILDAGQRGKNSLEIKSNSTEAIYMSEYLSNLIYISAVRIGCQDVFPIPEDSNSIDVGECGQYAPWLFNQFSDFDIDPNKRHPDETSLNFRKQFNAWINDIFPNAQANTEIIERTPFVRLELKKNQFEEWVRPVNIGYGYSYAFPIIVAGLLAKQDQILIIDSPEAHLHPRGQSQIAQFLGKIANSGVQVIIETHSDHVLNGIRISASKNIINSEDINILFFSQNNNNNKKQDIHCISNPMIDPSGNLSDWPDGFFDQYEQDLSILNGWN